MANPIRVLHVLGTLNRGGAESRIMDLYRHIDKEKVQFDFLVHSKGTDDFSPEVKALGGHIYTVPRFADTIWRLMNWGFVPFSLSTMSSP